MSDVVCFIFQKAQCGCSGSGSGVSAGDPLLSIHSNFGDKIWWLNASSEEVRFWLNVEVTERTGWQIGCRVREKLILTKVLGLSYWMTRFTVYWGWGQKRFGGVVSGIWFLTNSIWAAYLVFPIQCQVGNKGKSHEWRYKFGSHQQIVFKVITLDEATKGVKRIEKRRVRSLKATYAVKSEVAEEEPAKENKKWSNIQWVERTECGVPEATENVSRRQKWLTASNSHKICNVKTDDWSLFFWALLDDYSLNVCISIHLPVESVMRSEIL